MASCPRTHCGAPAGARESQGFRTPALRPDPPRRTGQRPALQYDDRELGFEQLLRHGEARGTTSHDADVGVEHRVARKKFAVGSARGRKRHGPASTVPSASSGDSYLISGLGSAHPVVASRPQTANSSKQLEAPRGYASAMTLSHGASATVAKVPTPRPRNALIPALCIVAYIVLAVAVYRPASPWNNSRLPSSPISASGVNGYGYGDAAQMTWFLAWVPTPYATA